MSPHTLMWLTLNTLASAVIYLTDGTRWPLLLSIALLCVGAWLILQSPRT